MGETEVTATAAGANVGRSDATRLFVKTFAAIMMTRLPFLGAGYGVDPDAFRVASTARAIAATHTYTASRLPGYPVQELTSALLSGGGPLALNGATAFMSAMGFSFFALTLRRLGHRAPFLTSLTAALVPVVYINSTTAMDYLWALGFLLAALFFVVERRIALAGALVGFAIGSRITSGLMLAPFALHLALKSEIPPRARVREVLELGLVAGAVGLACYVPVLRTYGLGALAHERNYPGLAAALKIATVDTWGLLGVVTLAAGVLLAVIRRDRAVELRRLTPWLLLIVLYLALFAELPNEAGYLIPLVPFVVLILGALLSRRHFLVVSAGLALSSFLVGISREATPGGPTASPLAIPVHLGSRAVVVDVLKGPILAAHSARIEAARYLTRVLARGRTLPEKSVVIVGYWWPQIAERYPAGSIEARRYMERFDENDAWQYPKQDGYVVYYLARQQEYNLYTGGIDVIKAGAKELEIEGE